MNAAGASRRDEAEFRVDAGDRNVTAPRTHHVGVTVIDLEASVEFCRDVLGMSVVTRSEVTGEDFAEGVGVEGASGEFVHLDGGDVRVEFDECDPEGRPQSGGDVNRPGTKHLGLAVSDVDPFYDDLPASVEATSDPQTTESGTRICFRRDPEENLVEVIEA